MRTLRSVVEEYLRGLGRLTDVHLGPGMAPAATAEQSRELSLAIAGAGRLNVFLMAIAVSMLCILFVTAVVLAFSFRTNIEAPLAGSTAALSASLAAAIWLRRLAVEMTVIKISLSILNEMPPERAAEFLTVLYWSHIRRLPAMHRGSQNISSSGEGHVTITGGERVKIGRLTVSHAPSRETQDS